jgi:hypothetical protein
MSYDEYLADKQIKVQREEMYLVTSDKWLVTSNEWLANSESEQKLVNSEQ